jgi:hypothetical protein
MIKTTKTHDVWINENEIDPRDEILEELRVSLVEEGIVIPTDDDFNNPAVNTAMLRRRDFDVNNGPLACEIK